MFTARPAADNRSPVGLNASEWSSNYCPQSPSRCAVQRGAAKRAPVPATSSRADYEFCGRVAQRDARHVRPVNTPASALADLVLREDLLSLLGSVKRPLPRLR